VRLGKNRLHRPPQHVFGRDQKALDEIYWFPECGFYVAGVEDKEGERVISKHLRDVNLGKEECQILSSMKI